MRARLKVWLLSFLTLAVFAVFAWLVGVVAGDALPPRVLLRIRIAIMGLALAATALVFRFLSKRWKGRIRGEKAAAREDKLKAIFKAARKRLKDSPRAREKTLRKLPSLLVLGPRGSTKTTVVENSGLNTELLEGETYRGDAIAPTELANLWYADGTVIVEAGGALLDEPEKWEALLSYTQPARLAAALGLGRQSSRVALVCVGCDEFTQPGATENIPILARKLRDRLVEAAEALGIWLPVYVLFTRADRLPFYDDFVRSMSADEAAQGLGVTLPLASASALPHADAEGARIAGALDELLHALRLKRREFLVRERDAAVQAGTYEFPRELEKIEGHLHRFLLELCRPSQLGRSPFLRGFHFTGVRALVVDEAGPARAAAPAPTDASALGATQVFDMARLQEAAARQAAVGRSRRIPDWAFLKPFFQKVLVPDEAARIMTTGGARVDFLRRGLLSVVGLAGLVWIVGLFVSWRGNQAMVERVEAAAAAVTEADLQLSSIPRREVVERLDTLRAQLVELRAHAVDGAPMGLTWGVYHGDDVLVPGLQVYLRAFEATLGGEARRLLLNRLAGLPEVPDETTDFRSVYDALKAYLILTDHPERSTEAFLPGALLANWDAARIQDEEWEGLLVRQLAFFAEVIRDLDTLQPEEPTVVASARAFLRDLSQEDQFYLNVLDEAGTRGQEIRLATAVPGSADLLRNDVVVEPWFTRAAYEWVDSVDAALMLQSEDWVLGPQATAIENAAELGDSVKARYRAAYAERWLQFLQATSVVPFGGASDAARRLDRLNDNDSPLLGAISLVARNTRPLPAEFQPLLALYPAPPPAEEGSEEQAAEEARLVRDSNQGYVEALRGLEGALQDLARSQGAEQQAAVQTASDAVQDGERAVEAIADGFLLEPEMARRSGEATRSLMEEPLRRARGLLGNFGPAQINGSGRSFCSQFNGYLSGYPFQRNAPGNAAIEDVAAALQPDEGLLWTFVEEQLISRGLVARRAGRFVETGAEPRPTAAFLTFINEAGAFAEALFDQGEARISFTLVPETTPVLSRIVIRVDNVRQETTPTDQGRATFVWIGDQAREAEIVAQVGGEEVDLQRPGPGTWALFRLFDTAQWNDLGGNFYQLTWTNTGGGQALRAELRLTGSPPVFQRSVLDRLTCVPNVVR